MEVITALIINIRILRETLFIMRAYPNAIKPIKVKLQTRKRSYQEEK